MGKGNQAATGAPAPSNAVALNEFDEKLRAACEKGDDAEVKKLLGKPININLQQNVYPNPMLH